MRAHSPLREFAEYVLVRSLTGTIFALPHSSAVLVGRLLGGLAFFGLSRLRQIGERNLSIAFPDMSLSARRRLLRGCFDSLGRQLGEFCHLRKATADSLSRIVEYDPQSRIRFEEAKAKGRGILFVTAHLGGWEILAFSQSAFGNSLSFLVRPIENPRIERYVDATRTRLGNTTIRKKHAGLTCMRILKNGGTLGILADLNALPQEGVFVPFFGRLACTTLAVTALAIPTGAVIFPVFAPWNPARRRYVVRGGPEVEIVQTGDPEQDICINTARVTSVIERYVRAYPDQWMWIHERWHALLRPGDRVCTDFPPV